MEGLFYHFKPYLIFALGFLCGSLDHPIKWVSVVLLLSASILIEYMRYLYRHFDYEEIEIKGINSGN